MLVFTPSSHYPATISVENRILAGETPVCKTVSSAVKQMAAGSIDIEVLEVFIPRQMATLENPRDAFVTATLWVDSLAFGTLWQVVHLQSDNAGCTDVHVPVTIR